MSLSSTKYLIIQTIVLAFFMIKSAYSDDLQLIGSVKHSMQQPEVNSSLKNSPVNNKKVIQLLKVQLSDEAKELLNQRIKNISASTLKPPISLQIDMPKQIQLGMNNVPVLDQGRHGTCATFAITGALDASLGKGDYISQLCHLQLGNYLEKHGYSSSGWEGSFAIEIINQIEQYGIVSQEKQRTIGCGGLTEYPTDSKDAPKSFIDPQQYYPMSEQIFGTKVSSSNIYWRISSSWTLNEVKNSLYSGDRAVFEILLPRIDLGVVGAVGNYKTAKDTWVLSSEIYYGVGFANAGHEMIITGYDDDAIAIDNHGTKHKGLLTLRNSWGSNYGDQGNFYMSYDYFKLLTFGVRRFTTH